MTQIFDVSDVPVDGIDGLWVNGDYVTLNPLATHSEYGRTTPVEKYRDRLWVKFYDGGQTQADAYLLGRYASHDERPWKADMVLSGVAYAIVTWTVGEEQFPRNDPQFLFVVRGMRLYDRRLDSTNGGIGSHRWGQPSTYGLTGNPIVMIENILRGITLPDGQTYGGGWSDDDLPASVWTAAMNICDQNVDGQPRYAAGYEVRIGTPDIGGDEPAEVIEELLTACAGEIADIGGEMLIRAGGPGLPEMFITDADVMIDRPQELDPFPGLFDTHTGVHATYPNPEDSYRPKEAPPRYDTGAEARSGQRLIANLQLTAVTDGLQVQRLMRSFLEDAPRHRRHVTCLPPDAMRLSPLSVLDWSSERNGYAGKDFEVGQIGIDPGSLAVTVSTREIDPADYDWSSEFGLPTFQPSPLQIVEIAQVVPGFAVAGVEIEDGSGNPRRPGLRMVWLTGFPDRVGLRWQVRVQGATSIVATGTVADADDGFAIVSEGILPATTYEVQARLVKAQRNMTAWTSWLSAVTPSIRFGVEDIDAGITEAIQDALDDAAAAAAAAQIVADDLAAEADTRLDGAIAQAQSLRSLRDSVLTLTDRVREGDYTGYLHTEQLRRTLSDTYESYAAGFDERITVATSATGALAERATILEAVNDTLSATVIALDQAIIDGDTALASQISAVSVGTALQFDAPVIWFWDTGPEGWTGTPANPSVVIPGFLRPAAGAGSAVISPAGLAIDTAKYRQVRAWHGVPDRRRGRAICGGARPARAGTRRAGSPSPSRDGSAMRPS